MKSKWLKSLPSQSWFGLKLFFEKWLRLIPYVYTDEIQHQCTATLKINMFETAEHERNPIKLGHPIFRLSNL